MHRRTASGMVDRPDDGPRPRTEADTIMVTDIKSPALDANGAAPGALRTETAVRQPPDSGKVAFGWWPLAIVAVAAAAWLSVVVARETRFTTGHRAAAA